MTAFIIAQWRDYEWHGPGMMGYGYGYFGVIFMLLLWVLVIAGIVLLIRWLIVSSRREVRREDTAIEILKKRYARGEIGKEEFEAKKKDIA